MLAVLPDLEGIEDGQKPDEHEDNAHDEAQSIYLGENKGIGKKRVNPMGSRFQQK
jgi:predicted GTPase